MKEHERRGNGETARTTEVPATLNRRFHPLKFTQASCSVPASLVLGYYFH